MKALIYRASGLVVKDLIGVLGRYGVTDAWVVGSALGDPGVEPYKPDLVLGLFALDNTASHDWLTVSDSRSSGLQNADIAVRLGAAVAQGIPALLIVPPDGPIPHRFGPLLIAQCDIDDNEVLNSALAPFFFPGSEPSSDALTLHPALGQDYYDMLIEELHALDSAPDSEMAPVAEVLLRDTLLSLGIRFAENPRRQEDAVDFAMVPSPGTNEPLFVGLKTGNLSESVLVEAEIRLQNSVVARGGGIGLLLYIDRNHGRFPQLVSMPLIIRMHYKEFLDELAVKPLARIIDERVEEAIDRL